MTNSWVSSRRLGCETPQFVKGMLSVRLLGIRSREEVDGAPVRATRRRKKERKNERTKEREKKEGKKTASNPLKYFRNPLCSAQPGKRYILQLPPETGLCNQSFPSVRQLLVHTGSQLGWKERGGDRKRERREGDSLALSDSGGEGEHYLRPKPQWWFPVALTGSSTPTHQPEELDRLNWCCDYTH